MTHTYIARTLRIEPRPVGRPRGSRDRTASARRVAAPDAERWALRLGVACRNARIERNVGADELAAAIGLKQASTVYDWENGRSLLSSVRIYQIAAALRMSVAELVEAA